MKALTTLHRWTGGFVGLLLALIGLSGTVLLWEESWIALPGAHAAVETGPDALGAVAERAFAQQEGLSRITFGDEGMALHQAIYADGGGAYFDQSATAVAHWPDKWGRPELWLFDLHHYLLLGESGKTATGVLGLLLIGFVVTGTILWWRTRRTFRLRAWPARMTRSAIVRQHRDLGVVAAPLLLLSAATGTAMVFPALADAVLKPWSNPAQAAPAPPTPAGPLAPETDWRALMADAQARFPGAVPRRLMLPAGPDQPITLRLRQAFEWTPNGRTYVYLDPASGRVIGVDDPAARDTATAIVEKFYPLHAAKTRSLLWRLALTLSGLALVVLGTFATWSFWFVPARPRAALAVG